MPPLHIGPETQGNNLSSTNGQVIVQQAWNKESSVVICVHVTGSPSQLNLQQLTMIMEEAYNEKPANRQPGVLVHLSPSDLQRPK